MAVRAATWPGVQVFDSRNLPLDQVVGEQPFISVFTDAMAGQTIGRDIAGVTSETTVALVFEIGITSPPPVSAPPPDSVPPVPTIDIPATDEAYEIAIDLMEGHVGNALTNPLNAWSELARRIITNIRANRSVRGGESQRGVRWAARQITFECDIIADPAPGVVLGPHHVVRDVMAAATAAGDPGLLKVVELIEAEFTTTAAPDWRQVQAILGLTEHEVRAIGLAPWGVPDETAATLAEVDPLDEPAEEGAGLNLFSKG